MQSTSCKENCPFSKQGFCSSYKECPNHIETWWVPEEGAQPIKLEDCSPKRMILQQQVMQARFDLTTQALVQSRNEYNQLCSYLKSLVESCQKVLEKNRVETSEEVKVIDVQNNPELS